MQLVEHDTAQVREERFCIAMRDQQCELLGGCQKDVGRALDLAGALGRRGVAGAGLDLDGESHLADRGFEIAGDVDRKRLQRRDIERVQPLALAATFGQLDQRGQEAGERLAGAGRCDQQGRAPRPGLLQQCELMRPHAPAAAGEPGGEGRGKGRGDRVHAPTEIGSVERNGNMRRAFSGSGRSLCTAVILSPGIHRKAPAFFDGSGGKPGMTS